MANSLKDPKTAGVVSRVAYTQGENFKETLHEGVATLGEIRDLTPEEGVEMKVFDKTLAVGTDGKGCRFKMGMRLDESIINAKETHALDLKVKVLTIGSQQVEIRLNSK